MAKIYQLNDFLSPDKFLERDSRLFDRKFAREMRALRAEDEAQFSENDVIMCEGDLTSLGLPVLATIPELKPFPKVPSAPSADEIIAASRNTEEVRAFIARARAMVNKEKGKGK